MTTMLVGLVTNAVSDESRWPGWLGWLQEHAWFSFVPRRLAAEFGPGMDARTRGQLGCPYGPDTQPSGIDLARVAFLPGPTGTCTASKPPVTPVTLFVLVCAGCGAELTVVLSQVSLPVHAHQKYGNGIQLPVLM